MLNCMQIYDFFAKKAYLCLRKSAQTHKLNMTKKDQFFDVLKNIFVGAKIEGDSGYVNLMRIKSIYYNEFKYKLQVDIAQKLNEVGQNFEAEMYNKLYTFFKKYFSESGAIYFSYTPLQEKIYERIYRDDKDVMLFWKTQMLYYVKTERLFKNMEVQDEGITYFFSVEELEHKKSNEKKELVFELEKADIEKGWQIYLKVKYATNGTKTKIDDIVAQLKKITGFKQYDYKRLEKALNVFKRQSEIDYFINKDAKTFLREQFSLWIKGYLLDDESLFEAERLKQLKALQHIAFNIIDLVSQFEDELVKIWNKPKFAHSSNYVITLDKIAERDFVLLGKILAHEGIQAQIQEWKDLGIATETFSLSAIFETDLEGKKLKKEWRYLPLDTRFVKEWEMEILALFDDLDNQLDGWLIHSENYQALNTLQQKFKEKVQTVYIDPPFNLDGSDQFDYRTNYKDGDWLTLLENRIRLAYSFINKSGSMFTRCDYNGNMLVRLLLNQIFGNENLINEIIVSRGKQRLGGTNIYSNATDSLYFFSKSAAFILAPYKRERYEGEAKGTNMLMKGERNPPERTFIDPDGNTVVLLPPPNTHWKLVQKKIDDMYRRGIIYLAKSQKGNNSGIRKIVDGKEIPVDYVPSFYFDDDKTIDSNWTDITGYSADWGFVTENAEPLLNRVISSSSKGTTNLVMDFFLGSGTTIAVSQKSKNKWIGIEMGEHFYKVILPRMKQVLNGEQKGVSKELNWQGGGFFKYYALEQYEETLSKVKYSDKNPVPTQDIYHQYLFLKDLKLSEAVLHLDEAGENVQVDLTKLHAKIDIPETLSHLLGKFIRQIRKDEVIFTDGTSIDLRKVDYKVIKPLIWW